MAATPSLSATTSLRLSLSVKLAKAAVVTVSGTMMQMRMQSSAQNACAHDVRRFAVEDGVACGIVRRCRSSIVVAERCHSTDSGSPDA